MKKEGKVASTMNIVMLGESQSGKSTTAGHFGCQMDTFDKRVLLKYERESAELNKASYKYAWFFDRLARERERGSSIDVSMWMFKTHKEQQHMLIDAPGRRKLISNTVRGISMADIGIVVIDSQEGQFEASWASDGVVKDHIVLAYTLGIKELIVAVNKLEDHSNKEARYHQIKDEMAPFIKKTGFKVDRTPFVPVSGLNGLNLTEPSVQFEWYKGPTLLGAIEQVQLSLRQINKPFRMPIHKIFKIGGVGTVVIGKVVAGTFHSEADVVMGPMDRQITTRSIEINFEALP